MTGQTKPLNRKAASKIDIWKQAQTIFQNGDLEEVPRLIKALAKSKDVQERRAAAYTLGGLGDRRALKQLLSTIRNQKENPGVRGEAAEALGYLCQFRPNPEAFRRLMTALSDSSVEVRFWSAFALGLIGNSKAILNLQHLVDADKNILSGWWGVAKEAQDAIQQIRKRVSQRSRKRPPKGASRGARPETAD